MYFIFDCTGAIVGNPKGYRTHKGAWQQASSWHTKVFRDIGLRFYAYSQIDASNTLIFTVKLIEA